MKPVVRLRFKTDHVVLLTLVAVLYFLYSSPLQSVYYFADEIDYLVWDIPLSQAIADFKTLALIDGRAAGYFIWIFLGKIATINGPGLLIVRLLQFSISCCTACLLYLLLRARNMSWRWAFFTILAIWIQPVLQIVHVYALIAFMVGICCSYLAFYLIYRIDTNHTRPMVLSVLGAVLLLMLAWTTHQATPFCGLAPLAYYALTASKENWRQDGTRFLLFFVTLAATLLVFTASYKIALSYSDVLSYAPAQRSFSLLSGNLPLIDYILLLHPRNYIGMFEWWNYLFPVKKLSNTIFNTATSLSMLTWITITSVALYIETKKINKRFVLQKYAVAGTSLILATLPLVADGFTQRQHIYIAAVPTLILILAYSTSVLVKACFHLEATKGFVKAFALALLLIVGLGAQANVQRGLVTPAARFHTFVETEMTRQLPKAFDRILVINKGGECAREPCRGFMGRRMSTANRADWWFRHYQFVLQKIIGTTYKTTPVEFVKNIDINQDLKTAIVIDFNLLYHTLNHNGEVF